MARLSIIQVICIIFAAEMMSKRLFGWMIAALLTAKK